MFKKEKPNSLKEATIKTSKFKELLGHSLTFLLLASCVPVWLNLLDTNIDSRLEERILPAHILSPLAQTIKTNIRQTQSYLQNFFKGSEYEGVADSINVKTRDTYSLGDILWKRNEYNAFGAQKYVNIPTQLLEQELLEAQALQAIQNQGVLENKSGPDILHEMLGYMKNNKSRSVLTNWFLNYDTKNPDEVNQVIDFVLIHEFTHNILHKKIEDEKDKLPALTRNNNFLISFEEAACDIMAILINAKRHNMDKAQIVEFLDKQIAFRFSTRQTVLQAAKLTGKKMEPDHDTEAGLYLLRNFIVDKDTEQLKKMSLEEQVSLAIDLSQKNFDIIQLSNLDKISSEYEKKVAQKLNVPHEDLFIFLDNLDYRIMQIARKNSLFFKVEGMKILNKPVVR